MNRTSIFHRQNATLTPSLRAIFYAALSCLIWFLTVPSLHGQATSSSLEHPFTMVFADGSPAFLTISDGDELTIDPLDKPLNAYGIQIAFDGTENARLVSIAHGEFALKFQDREILRFRINKEADKLTTDFPSQLILPFTWLVRGEPRQEVHLMDRSIQIVERLRVEENGYLWLDQDFPYYENKFLWGVQSGQLPQIQAFRRINLKYYSDGLNKLNHRQMSLPTSTTGIKQGLVHNLDSDVYYAIQEVQFADPAVERIFLLKSYSPATDRGHCVILNIPNPSSSQQVSSVTLDYLGRLVMTVDKQNYRVDPSGSLTLDPGISSNPYRFYNNYVTSSGQWIIPVFAGIALPEGSHKMEVSCTGSWYVPDPAAETWSKQYGKIENEIQTLYQQIQKTNTPSERYNNLLKQRDDMLKNKPESTGERVKGTKSSSESFQVLFTPEKDFPWTIDGEFNGDKDGTNKRERYFPSGMDPEDKLQEMEVEECYVQMDGSEPMSYWHIDEYTGKGIMYADWDNDAQRQAAMDAAIKNATRYIGFGGEEGPWSQQMDLYDRQVFNIRGLPLNHMEGPYPELRYVYQETTGSYDTRKEAATHCPSPRHNKGKYECYVDKVLSVCLDNYDFTRVDERNVTNYDALHCKVEAAQKDPSKGPEIVIEFSAPGYLTATRALQKRQLEVGEILLSGHVTSKNGDEITGATVRFKGIDGQTVTEEEGIYHLTSRADGTEPHSEVMDIRLQAIGLEISHDELGIYEGRPFGLVSDGFTTLVLKVKAEGIRPNTVSVKPARLGDFVERTMLKVPLVLDGKGEGVLEYVPPNYLTDADLTVQVPLTKETAGKYGLKTSIWAAEVPVEFTWEDEEGNAGSQTITLYVTRPPIMLIHGFTGDETTWADLGAYLRDRKYESILREYYKGPADESTIERQSQKLETYIRDLRKAFLDNGFLHTRVDLVVHSMGGLISRHYISNMARYGEKAGIYIPYNVKLSRDELAAQRFKEPVKLIDVRKLIMVGTPNHGASWIDEQIGALSAWSTGFHQVANGQLRSDSPFLARLNAGESEGRHLSMYVQYALLHGRRRLAPYWPPDIWKYQYSKAWSLATRALTDDDGVVMTTSALLNGVQSFAFPPTEDAPFGFIHSPALGPVYMGDQSITTHPDIFTKVNELLLEDIPRMPLKNAYAKILRSEGDARMRYFSTDTWSDIAATVNAKLDNPWCQFNTGDGSAAIAYYLEGHHWATLHIMPQTTLYMETVSPEFVKVYIETGRARFRSRKQGGGGFDVVLGEQGEKWYNFNPQARVRDVQTDFTVEKGQTIKAQSISGKVFMGVAGADNDQDDAMALNNRRGVELDDNGNLTEYTVPDSGWWSAIDTAYLEDAETDSLVGDNLVTNGSFEEGPVAGSYRVLRKGDTIPGWTVDRATVDLTGTYFDAADGTNSLDLVGTPGYGTIAQILPTTPGAVYQLNFMMAGNSAGGPPVKILKVEAGDQSKEFSFDITGKSIRNMGWEPRSWTFRATETRTTLVFAAAEMTPPTNYGPAIDDVRVFRIAEDGWVEPPVEKIIPLEDIGHVTLMIGAPYLPVSGFADLTLEATNTDGAPLASPYEVAVTIAGHDSVSFVEVGQPAGVIDESGSFKTSLLMNEPDPLASTSLADIPLVVTVDIRIRNPRTEEVVYDSIVQVPLGMTLLQGTTTGPHFTPRQEPLPPEFYDPSYQIANQADDQGHFYILFNTSLFDQDVERYRKLAQRRQEIFSMDIFDFTLEWSGATSLPLKYRLPASIIEQLKPGTVISIREDKGIDLLSPEEHEARLRGMVASFAERLPLVTNSKTALLNLLKTLDFEYGAETAWAPPTVKVINGIPHIHTTTAPEVFWTAEFSDPENTPAYVAMSHAAGHVLYEALIAAENHHYEFLSGHCAGTKALWTHYVYDDQAYFDKAEYVSFYEAGADLFAWAMWRYLTQEEAPFLAQSLYANSAYLPQFATRDHAADSKLRYPGYAVSGPQTAFLVEYYRQAGFEDPVALFADFLADHLRKPKGRHLNLTIKTWLAAQETIISETDIIHLTDVYGLDKSDDGITLFPQADFATAAVELNGAIISDFSDIPLIEIDGNMHIKVLNGTFELERNLKGRSRRTTLFTGADLHVRSDQGLDYRTGPVWSTSPITLQNQLATVSGGELGVYIIPEEEDVLIYVLKGTAHIVSEKGDREAGVMEYIKMNKKGKMKKPKKIDEEVLKEIKDQVMRSYPVVDPFLPVGEVEDAVGAG